MVYVVDRTIPVVVALKQIDNQRYGSASVSGKIYCPCHPNFDTPAAKIYIGNKEKDEPDSIVCFSEHKSYKVSDFIEKGLIQRFGHPLRLNQVFSRVWDQLSESKREQFMESFAGNIGVTQDGYSTEQLNLLDQFRLAGTPYALSEYQQGMTIVQHLENIIRIEFELKEGDTNG